MAENTQSPARANTSHVSPLDPDFLVFALPLAFLIDISSYLLGGLDLGVTAIVVNLILGVPLFIWMIIRGKNIEEAKQQMQTRTKNLQGSLAAKRKTRKVAMRKGIKRGLILFIGNSIPIVNFIPFWLIGVVMMLRER
ncbi:MAG: hypothetical protein Q8P39_00320 [Candidatus Yanofskybacteria bacterium]|nr:hypothetical protein [Candidatus Yanofskybacteria bacterium]